MIFRLLLSALISSWQFFKESSPAPTIEIKLANADWQELNLRPKSKSFFVTLKSLFFNPVWNEALYIFDCAERLVLEKSPKDEKELTERIKARLENINADHFQFRITLQTRTEKEIAFISELKEIN